MGNPPEKIEKILAETPCFSGVDDPFLGERDKWSQRI